MINDARELIGQLDISSELVGELNNAVTLSGELETDVELVGELTTTNELIGELTTTNELVGELETTNELIGEININSSGGTLNYEYLYNKPKINNVELFRDKSLDELGIQAKGECPSESISNTEIEDLLSGFVG